MLCIVNISSDADTYQTYQYILVSNEALLTITIVVGLIHIKCSTSINLYYTYLRLVNTDTLHLGTKVS